MTRRAGSWRASTVSAWRGSRQSADASAIAAATRSCGRWSMGSTLGEGTGIPGDKGKCGAETQSPRVREITPRARHLGQLLPAHAGGDGNSDQEVAPHGGASYRPHAPTNRLPNVVARPHDAWGSTGSPGGVRRLLRPRAGGEPGGGHGRRAHGVRGGRALLRDRAAALGGRDLVSDAPARVHRRPPALGTPAVGALPALRPVEGVRARGARHGDRLSRRRRRERPPPPRRLPPALRAPRRVVRAGEERTREPGLRLRHAAHRALGLDDPRAAGPEPDAAPVP